MVAELSAVEEAVVSFQDRAVNWWTNLWQDVRYGLRLLAKGPLFAAVAICSLALGIGANTAIFSAIKTILLDSLNIPQPEQLRVLRWEFPGGQPMYSLSGDLEQTESGATTSTSFSYPIYQSLQGDTGAFENLAAFDPEARKFIALVNAQPEPVSVLMVSGNFFSTLRVVASAGRTLLPSDDVAVGSGSVVELSDAYWRRRFGASKNVIGTVVRLNGIPMTIVGIASASFTGPELGKGPDMYVPLTMDPILDPLGDPLVSAGLSHDSLTDPERWWLALIGRVKPHPGQDQAIAALKVIFANTVQSSLGKNHKNLDQLRLEVMPGNRGIQPLNNKFSQTAHLLIVVVGLVLLLACANLANLLLARSTTRKRELSLRIALGAKRSRIMRQVLTENVLLALVGGGVGLLIGYMGRNLVPDILHRNITVTFDWQVITFTLGISLVTALLFGGFPAWQAARTDIQSGLLDSTRMTSPKSKAVLRKALIVVQVCLSAVLLIGSGLFLTTLSNLLHTELGFHANNLLLFDLNLPVTQYNTGQSRLAILQKIRERITDLPGVKSATFSSSALLAGNTSTTNFDLNNNSPTHEKAWLNVVSQDYFATMGIPLVAGRAFKQGDFNSHSKIAIVNLRLVHEFFPNRNPIGITFNDDHIRIVGICGDAKFKDLRMDPPPTYYVPYAQSPTANSLTFAVKTQIPPGSLTEAIRNQVRSQDSALPITYIRTQREQLDESLGKEKLFASLTSGFALVALLLACVGIYGITAYTVSRRTNEIGIRMALGAQALQVLSMILREACWLALAGIGIAIALSLILGRLVQGFLYGLRSNNPTILVGSSVLLLAITLAASWVPARKAARIDPMNALRHQ